MVEATGKGLLAPGAPELVSIILVNYNGMADLDACLTSMLAQSYRDFEIILIDSGSTDESADLVATRYPQVQLVREGNIGYGAGNNLGFGLAKGEYLVVSNTDVEVHPDWLLYLVEAAKQDEGIGLVAPKILFFDDRNMINGCGDLVHFTGFATCRGRGEPSQHFSGQEDLFCPSGASFLIKRGVLQHVGMIDLGIQSTFGKERRTTQDYYLGADLAWRALLADFRIILEPRALVYHKYAVKPLTAARFRDIERARLTYVLANYSSATLVILAPSLLLAELVSLGFGLLGGTSFLRTKLGVYGWLYQNRDFIRSKRRANQALRKTPDKAHFNLMSPVIEFTHQTSSGGVMAAIQSALNLVFRLLYSISSISIRQFS